MSSRASLVCHIGNGAVKAAVVVLDKNSTIPRILSTRVRTLGYQEFLDRQHLEDRIMSEFNELMKDVKLKDLTSPALKGITIQDASVVLSSPWYVSEIKSIVIENEKPFEFTKTLLDKALSDSAKDYYANGSKVTLLEQHITRCLLNGYPTASPLKKTVKHVELSIFQSVIARGRVAQIREMILSALHVRNATVHSQLLASFLTLRTVAGHMQNYVFAETSAQMVELLSVIDDRITRSVSFPYGMQFVVEEFAKKLSSTKEVAVSFIRNANKDSILDPAAKDKMTTSLNEVSALWQTQFGKALAGLSGDSLLSNDLILMSSTEGEFIFKSFIANNSYPQTTSIEGNFKVHALHPDDFAGVCKIADGVEKDISLLVATVFHFTRYQKSSEGVL